MRRPAAAPPPGLGGGGACSPRVALMAALPPAAALSPMRELTPGWRRTPRMDARRRHSGGSRRVPECPGDRTSSHAHIAHYTRTCMTLACMWWGPLEPFASTAACVSLLVSLASWSRRVVIACAVSPCAVSTVLVFVPKSQTVLVLSNFQSNKARTHAQALARNQGRLRPRRLRRRAPRASPPLTDVVAAGLVARPAPPASLVHLHRCPLPSAFLVISDSLASQLRLGGLASAASPAPCRPRLAAGARHPPADGPTRPPSSSTSRPFSIHSIQLQSAVHRRPVLQLATSRASLGCTVIINDQLHVARRRIVQRTRGSRRINQHHSVPGVILDSLASPAYPTLHFLPASSACLGQHLAALLHLQHRSAPSARLQLAAPVTLPRFLATIVVSSAARAPRARCQPLCTHSSTA